MRQPGRPYRVPPRPGSVACALDHDQGLRRRGPAGEAGELAGVSDGLQVHEDDVGVGVLVPVLQEVVAGDVGAVAGRHESGHARDAGDASAAPVQARQQGDADGAGLGEQPDPAGAGHLGGERGVQPYVGGRVDDAEGVRTDDPHAVRARLPHQGALAFPAVGAGLGVAGGDDHEPLHAVLAALGDHLGDALGGHRDDRQVDGAVDLAHRAEGGHPVELLPPFRQGPVHGVQAAGEPGVPDVVEDAASHAAGGAAGADDGHRPGGEQPLHGARLGALLARVLHGQGAVGGFEVELQADDAVLEAALLGVPGVGEHLDHLGVGGQHLGGEPADAALPRDGADVFEQGGGDAPALVGVLHEEGDLGLVGRRGGGRPVGADPVVAYGGDELAAHGGGESHPVHEVVVREAVDVLGGQTRVGREEAVVLRLVRHLLVEADQALGVIDGDGADARGAAVAQHHVGLPVGGVLVPVRRGLHGPQSTARARQRREAVCGGRRTGPRPRSGTHPGAGAGATPGMLHGMGNWSRQP